MKKLLIIGAILVMGTLGYAGEYTELKEDGTGGTSLTLKTTGNVVSAANKAILVITPTLSAGASGDALEFNFGSLIPGANTTLRGKFQAQVLTGDNEREYGILEDGNGGNIKVGFVKNGDVATDTLKNKETGSAINRANDKLGTLTYELTAASGVKDSGKTYVGEVISTLEAISNKTGAFFDRTVSIAVKIENLQLTVKK